MRHLSADRLAALADEAPTTEEQAHLAACAACAVERDAHRRIVASAALERTRAGAPLSDWAGIAAQLRTDGIIRSADPAPLPFARPAAAPARRRVVPAWAMRAAAGLALVAGGAAAGRLTSRTPAEIRPLATVPADSGSTGLAQTVANTSTAAVPSQFTSAAQAQLAMAAAERTYQAAMEYLATSDTTLKVRSKEPVDVYRARLAAFDQALAATRRALSAAPTDPVMNSYYLSSVSAREATLRQIDDALPVNERVTRF